MSITLQVVAAEDLIDAGRAKLQDNDEVLAAAIAATDAALVAHNSAGHSGVLYTKAEVDAKIASLSVAARTIRYTFGVTNNSEVFIAGLAANAMPIDLAGSITSISVIGDDGQIVGSATAAESEFPCSAGDYLMIHVGNDFAIGSEVAYGLSVHKNGSSSELVAFRKIYRSVHLTGPYTVVVTYTTTV